MYKNAADYIRGKITLAPKIAIVNGVRLGKLKSIIKEAVTFI